MREGSLPADQTELLALKQAANSAAPSDAPVEARATESSFLGVSRNWPGIFDTDSAPSDSTGAVGRTRYIELVNRKFAIYNKNSGAAIATDALSTLTESPAGANVFDPQVIWDPQTKRFYYVTVEVRSETDNRLAIGWSKTASPSNGTTDWCHYNLAYGASFPDYPKLGDSRDFLLIGVNTFGLSASFTGSDAIALTKPATGTTCEDAVKIGVTVEPDLGIMFGGSAFTPVPANQIDTAGVGWIVARSAGLPSRFFSLHRVTENADGTANIVNPGARLRVPSHTVPPDAPQQNSPNVLDTLDARPTQAISAIDPIRANVNAIWTQHTVLGPSGRAIIRWYEINPVARTLLQSGVVASGLYNFNAAISPNRAVNGTTKAGGDSMVLGLNRSGSTIFPEIAMVSKVGEAAQSPALGVKLSTGPYAGFDCPGGGDTVCSWGDYSAATPDPTPPAGTEPGVWLTNQYASGGSLTTQANWLTWNWLAAP